MTHSFPTRRSSDLINGLLDASGVMSQGADLVDKANDKVVKMRFRTKAQQADEAAGDSAAGGEGEGEGIDEEHEEIADDGSQDGDRKSVGEGKSVAVRVDRGGGRNNK